MRNRLLSVVLFTFSTAAVGNQVATLPQKVTVEVTGNLAVLAFLPQGSYHPAEADQPCALELIGDLGSDDALSADLGKDLGTISDLLSLICLSGGVPQRVDFRSLDDPPDDTGPVSSVVDPVQYAHVHIGFRHFEGSQSSVVISHGKVFDAWLEFTNEWRTSASLSLRRASPEVGGGPASFVTSYITSGAYVVDILPGDERPYEWFAREMEGFFRYGDRVSFMHPDREVELVPAIAGAIRATEYITAQNSQTGTVLRSLQSICTGEVPQVCRVDWSADQKVGLLGWGSLQSFTSVLPPAHGRHADMLTKTLLPGIFWTQENEAMKKWANENMSKTETDHSYWVWTKTDKWALVESYEEESRWNRQFVDLFLESWRR